MCPLVHWNIIHRVITYLTAVSGACTVAGIAEVLLWNELHRNEDLYWILKRHTRCGSLRHNAGFCGGLLL